MSDSPSPEAHALLEQVPRLRRLAQALVADAAAADDLMQDAWVAWLKSGRPAEGSTGWFAGTLRNLARQRGRGKARRVARERTAARPEADQDPTELVDRAQLHGALVQAVTELREPYRSTLLLRYLEERPPRAIAKLQGVSVNTVNTRLVRGLADLRTQLDGSRGGREGWMSALAAWAYPSSKSLLPIGALVMASSTQTAIVGTLALLTLVGGWWWLDSGSPAPAESSGAAPVVDARLAESEGSAAAAGTTAQAEPRQIVESSEPAAVAETATLVVRTVSSSTGAPLACRVSLAVEDLADTPADSKLARVGESTDADGLRTFRVRAGQVIEVDASGGFQREIGKATLEVPPLASGERREVELIVPHGADRLWFGRVVAAEDGSPIGGAAVRLEDSISWRRGTGDPVAETVSRSDGVFELAVPGHRPTIAWVRAAGRSPELVGLQLDYDRAGSEQEIRLSLAPRLEVDLVSDGPLPEGASVRALVPSFLWVGTEGVSLPLAWKPDPSWTLPVEDRATVVFEDLPVGVPIELDLLDGDRILSSVPEPLLLASGEVLGVSLEATGSATVRGRALEPDGTPTEDLEVWLRPAEYDGPRVFSELDRSELRASTRTDSGGAFAFEGLTTGLWWVGLAPAKSRNLFQGQPADGVAAAAVAVRVVDGAATEVELSVYRSLSIRGRVLDGGGEPTAGARVTGVSASYGGTWSAISGTDGSFVLGSLVPGDLQLSAWRQGATTAPIQAAAGQESVELRFPAAGRLEGRLEGLPDGAIGAVVLVTPTGGVGEAERLIPRDRLRFLQLGAERSYRVEGLPPGSYDVSAYVGTEWAATLGGAEVRVGETTEDVNLPFEPSCTLVVVSPGEVAYARIDAYQGEALVGTQWAEPGGEARLTVLPRRTLVIVRGPSNEVLQRSEVYPRSGESLQVTAD